MNPIKDIISSLFVWPLASVGQFNETDFQWRHILPTQMVLMPSAGLFNMFVSIDLFDTIKRVIMVCFNHSILPY